MLSPPILRLSDLSVSMAGVTVLDGVSLEIGAGEMVGLVGESGSGKSVTALAIMRLLPEGIGRIDAGRIRFGGIDMAGLDRAGLNALRGRDIGMIFQEPMTALNPVFRIGDQIAETLSLHGQAGDAGRQAVALLDMVGIPAPDAAARRYPHELSGGQRQRVMIAMALALRPKLLIADEPTTALDVTVQAQILDLIGRLRRELGMAVLLITHDLGLVGQHCDRVAVMYAGRVVETGAVDAVFDRPRHRYTEALMLTAPSANPAGAPLPVIAGQVPSPRRRPPGCAFHPRCGHALDRCRNEAPRLAGDPHAHACWNPA